MITEVKIMYKNIGTKIKTIVKIFTWIDIVIFAVSGGFLLGLGAVQKNIAYIIIGLCILIIFPVLSWLGSLMAYAFGELVEDVSYIRNSIEQDDIEESKENTAQ